MSAPQVIFGCASVGASYTKEDELRELARALQAADITRVDTAARYPPTSPGASEKLLGLAGYGKQFMVDTKVFISGDGSGSLAAAAIGKSLDQSFQSLGVEKVAEVNVLYCHGPDKTTPIEEQAAAFNKYHKEGKFAHLGVSNFSLGMLEEWFAISEKHGYIKPSYYQGQYNLLCRDYEEGLFPFLRRHGVHFVAFSPLAGGFLTGKLTPTTSPGSLKGTRFEIADSNPFGKAFRHWYDKPAMHKAMARFQALCDANNISPEGAALRWILHHSALQGGDGIVLGASRVSQVENSSKLMAEGPLSESLAKQILELWDICKTEAATIVQY